MTKKGINLVYSAKKEKAKAKRRKQVIEALMSWKVKEYEKTNRNLKFYLVLYLVLFSVTAYGLISNNLLLSILTILIGFTFFIFERKEPQDMDFAITKEGILLHDRLHSYETLKSFWIEYEPEGVKEISFRTNQVLNPFIKVPIYKSDPSKIRKLLIKFIPEEEHKSELADFIDRF